MPEKNQDRTASGDRKSPVAAQDFLEEMSFFGLTCPNHSTMIETMGSGVLWCGCQDDDECAWETLRFAWSEVGSQGRVEDWIHSD